LLVPLTVRIPTMTTYREWRPNLPPERFNDLQWRSRKVSPRNVTLQYSATWHIVR